MIHYEETMNRRPANPAPAHAAGNPKPGMIDELLQRFDAWAGIPERYEVEDRDLLATA